MENACQMGDFMIKVSNWEAGFFCMNCHKELNTDERTQNHSVCPYCGHSAGTTICETYIRAKRWVVDKPGNPWLFRKEKGHWEYGKRQVNG